MSVADAGTRWNTRWPAIRDPAGKGGRVQRRSGHVLVVDDDALNRRLLTATLAREGIRTTTANDGSHTDTLTKGTTGTFTYQVCNAGTSTCSNNASVTF